MNPYERSPRGGHQRGLTETCDHGIVGRAHPFCNWYGATIVDVFPKTCPLQGANPLDVLFQYLKLGWEILRKSDPCYDHGDVAEARELLDQVEVCKRCMGDGISANPTVRRLRDDISRKGAR